MDVSKNQKWFGSLSSLCVFSVWKRSDSILVCQDVGSDLCITRDDSPRQMAIGRTLKKTGNLFTDHYDIFRFLPKNGNLLFKVPKIMAFRKRTKNDNFL